MMKRIDNPLVTIIIINYNCSPLILNCIRTILNLRYRPLEVIIVDNGSTDESLKRIKKILKSLNLKHIKVKLYRFERNYGFAFAVNFAFQKRDTKAKYIALINNDFAPEPDSLQRLIDILENRIDLAGIQGIILNSKGEIDTAGIFLTNLWNYFPNKKLKSSSKGIYCTYIDGSYSVYRVQAILAVKRMFLQRLFMYGEDLELGIRLWRNGFKLACMPIIAGTHYRSTTARKLPNFSTYLLKRNIIAVMICYDKMYLVKLLLKLIESMIAALVNRSNMIMRGFIDGILLGISLRKDVKVLRSQVKTAKEPIIKMNALKWYTFMMKILLRSKGNLRKLIINNLHDELSRYEKQFCN